MLVIVADLIIWKDECKRHGDVPDAEIGIYNNIYDAQEHCDIILKEDVKPTKLKKPKKIITYIKYP